MTPTMSSQSTSVVIAIDFGTSRSGYAYAFRADQQIVRNTNWANQPVPYPKTLTQLLYQDSEAVAWGWSARRALEEMREAFDIKKYYLFESFKMALCGGANQIPSIINNGKSFSVVQLVADYLRKLKEVVLKQMNHETGGYVNNEDILWCLTVPAIWTEPEKRLMRQAAQQAGLISESEFDQQRLLLVLEPEAAAIYCQQKETDRSLLFPGSRLMVVDCGGGTVDITAHEVTQDYEFREIVKGSGGPYGSIYIDRQFKQYLEAKFSSYVLDQFKLEKPLGYIEILDTWEQIKCQYNPQDSQQVTLFRMSASFYKFLLQKYPDRLEQLAEEQGGDDQRIHINQQFMTAFFAPALEGILHEVNAQFQRLGDRGCDFMYLVGGFSNSPLLQQCLEAEFSSKVKQKIIKPQRQDAPGAAIVEGAVLYGLNPDTWIRERCSRMTYGYEVRQPFEEGIDPEHKRVKSEKKISYCDGRFFSFIHAGDSIGVSQSIDQIVFPFLSTDKEVSLRFYAAKNQQIRYVDEEDVEYLGKMEIKIPEAKNQEKRKINISVYFGRTEIEVKAKELITNQEYKTTLQFLDTDLDESSKAVKIDN